MSIAQDLIDEAKRIRQKLRNPPNAVYDPGIDLTRKSTAYRGHEPIPDPPIKKLLEVPEPIAIPVVPPVIFPIGLDDIVNAVSVHYDISTEAIRGPGRQTPTVYARRVVVYLSIKLLAKRSLASIARDLDKDHTSILHARDMINATVASNPEIHHEINMLCQSIEDHHRPAISAFGECGLALQ